ncbi:MAG: hypothetical protein RPT11_00480 [Bermanella sp.]
MTSAHLESFIAFDNDESNVAAIKLIIPADRLGSDRNEHFYAMDIREAMALGQQLLAMVAEQECNWASVD